MLCRYRSALRGNDYSRRLLGVVALAMPIAIAVLFAVAVPVYDRVCPGNGWPQIYRPPLEAQRLICSFKNSDHLQAEPPIGDRQILLADAVYKVLAFQFEGFLLFDVRHIRIAIVIGVSELRKSIVMWWNLDPSIIDLEFLQGLGVVIDDHPARADHGHLANFFGSNQLFWINAQRFFLKANCIMVTSSTPRVMWLLPWQETLMGSSSSRCSKMEMS